MTARKWVTAVTVAVLVCATAVAIAKKKAAKGDKMEETDNVAIATMLLQDGFLDRASAVLEAVDPASEELDQKQYWRLRGIVSLRQQKYREAAEHLELAILAGDSEPRLHLLRGQALAAAKQFVVAARALENAPAGIRKFPDYFLLRAQVEWERGERAKAFVVLDEGVQRFPNERKIGQQRLFILVEMGLYQAAIDASRQFFERSDTGPDDYVALAEALRKGGQVDRALLLLEEAALRYPYEAAIRVQLAATYLQLERPVTAAEVLRPLAWSESERAFQAAELYKKGGSLHRAVRMNERVRDQKQKLRQRMAILIEQEDFEKAAALYPRVARLGLLEDQTILYAAAYAFFQIKDYDRTELLLSQITDAGLFKKGVELRRAIEVCRQASWKCN